VEQEEDHAVALHGLTVSPEGFMALFKTEGDISSNLVVAVQVDCTASEASSPAALTLCQLFQDIDMAGFILPPDSLSTKYAEQAALQLEYNDTVYDFDTSSPWLRAQCSAQLPHLELFKVVLRAAQEGTFTTTSNQVGESLLFELHCLRSGGATGTLSNVVVSKDVSSFEAVALSLRYKQAKFFVAAEVLQKGLANSRSSQRVLPALGLAVFPEAELGERFPLWKSKADASEQAARVTKTITASAEASALEGALRVAQERGDSEAEAKIRKALEKKLSDTIPLLAEGPPTAESEVEGQEEEVEREAVPNSVSPGAAAVAAAVAATTSDKTANAATAGTSDFPEPQESRAEEQLKNLRLILLGLDPIISN